MINYGADRPVFRQIADVLRDRIRAGQRLQSTLSISQEFGVNRNTARKALDVLVGDGLIVIRSGYGPVVLEQAEGGEVETVRLYRGAQVTFRLPTEQDRYELGLPLTAVVPIVEVTVGGRSRIYRGDRVRLTSA
ncbi:GntR family transcriptional regulator [Micromonospora haikouensis]|uniref:GntR family transcriptional regulator n=1 Tax=Micromonospora haikouensis TaxID=686309 RepID=UPI003D74E7AB